MNPEKLWKTAVTLTGKLVRLESMSEAYIPALAASGKDKSIWEDMLYGNLTGEKSMATWVHEMHRRQQAGKDLPFTVTHLVSGVETGANRYLLILMDGTLRDSVIFSILNSECEG